MERCAAISSGQIRAARALLNWSQDKLALASGLSSATIRKLELGHISPRHSTAHGIIGALEQAGVEFIEPDGVRARSKDILIFQGANGFEMLMEDMRQTVQRRGGDLSIVIGSEPGVLPEPNALTQSESYHDLFKMSERIRVRCLVTDRPPQLGEHSRFECRSLSSSYVDPMPFFIYGDKHALFIPHYGRSPKIIVMQSSTAVAMARRHFDSMWDKAPSYAAVLHPLRLASTSRAYQ